MPWRAPYHLVPPPELIDVTREVPAPTGAGTVVVIHSQTLHTSHPNHSPHRRLAYSSHWVTADAKCGSEALRHAYSRTVGHARYPHHSP